MQHAHFNAAVKQCCIICNALKIQKLSNFKLFFKIHMKAFPISNATTICAY